ncbi:hypothetical protein F5J12DRAFT_847161 [Pisolithus orientalis]|uniref:uncharacterized protein n=1 Tax=Pisolithus orientalis TaxID=936130 RepID=UPI002224176A|nr:uncharacterized protein F5J12DRAFT_847161 [Pisolithus orientalis]KAI5999850.1 hypothetical protein F5J12DRAFT_847161 [Pisolithus orientalis]
MGGTTDLLQVAGPTNGSSCNTTLSQVFSFAYSSSALQQCVFYVFNDYQGAVLPVSIMAIIPGGESIMLRSDVTMMSDDWTADVQAGASNDASCLSSTPSSSESILLLLQPGTSSPSTISPSISHTGSSSSTNSFVATIAGVAVGGVFALAAPVTLGLCLIQRRRRNDSTYSHLGPHSSPPLHPGDLYRFDVSTTAQGYSLQYERDRAPSFVLPGQTSPRMALPALQNTHSLSRTSTTLQQDSVANIPSVPSFSGSTRHNNVHAHAECVSAPASQVIYFLPSYSETSGPRGHHHRQQRRAGI